jgi:hypothetical protein
MVYHCDGFVWIVALAGPVEGHAVLRIRAAGDDVVKQLRIPRRGNEVEDFEGVVACAASSKRICNFSVLIYTTGVRTVVDQPVEGFAVMGKIPGDLSVSLAPFGQHMYLYLLEHLVALGFHVVAEFDEEFDHVQRGRWTYQQMSLDISAMLKQTSHEWQVGRCEAAVKVRVESGQWSCGK